MKVLFCHSSADNLAGSETVLLNLLRHFSPRIEPHVLLPGQGVFHDRLVRMGVTVHVLDVQPFSRRHPLGFAHSLQRMHRLLRRVRPALVHTTNASPMQYTLPVARALHIPVVCHVQCYYPPRDLRRYFPHLADQVILISRYVGSNFDPRFRHKLNVILNGVESPAIDRAEARRALARACGFPPACPVVGMVGQILPHKGVDDFLAACRRLTQAFPDLAIAMVGEDQHEFALSMKKLACTLGLGSRIAWVGRRSNAQHWMAGMDALAVPSLQEGFGLVAAEAMAIGTPVVASDRGGLREVVEHEVTGLVAPARSPEALADRLSALLRSPELAARLARAALRKARSEFSADHQAQAVEALYGRVVGAPGREGRRDASPHERSALRERDPGKSSASPRQRAEDRPATEPEHEDAAH